ncbi:MAG: MBOAT family protein [Chitinivibrionales bacterium]|nr:MBOAT family protein [Chitinivibrionales bacterium]
MVFSSHYFLFYFMPIFLLVYYLLVFTRLNISWVNLWVTLASYFFYGWFEPWFVVLMWISTIVDYACGRAIATPEKVDPRKMGVQDVKDEFGAVNIFYPFFLGVGWLYNLVIPEDEKRQKLIKNTALVVSMVVNLGLLGFFKYYMFVMNGIDRLAMMVGADSNLFLIMNVTLPIGISFYTFQTMSYTIDVWRGDAPPVKDMRTFSCFVALFPQLIAGPIIRYNTVAEQLATRKHNISRFASGLAIFTTGFAKKILLANPAGQIADMAFQADAPGVIGAWLGALGYHFQIYFDFCGYSDMAVGLGRMMGFEFIKNFSGPYRAESMSDFWNRWHISLSTWIRDYLYIGLGGNRKGVRRTYFNLAISMFLCGVWHGAKMTFIFWGVLHGAFLIWERTMGRRPIYDRFPLIAKIAITNVIVIFTWVVFRAASIDQAFHYWGSMLGLVQAAPSAAMLKTEMLRMSHMVELAICAFFVWQPIQAHEWTSKLTPAKCLVLALLLIFAAISMFTQAFNPFLYFQF